MSISANVGLNISLLPQAAVSGSGPRLCPHESGGGGEGWGEGAREQWQCLIGRARTGFANPIKLRCKTGFLSVSEGDIFGCL